MPYRYAENEVPITRAKCDVLIPTKGTTARPGARFGPRAIRAASYRIIPDFASNIETGDNTFKSWAKIVDCGDAPLTFLDNSVALKQLGEAHRRVGGRGSASDNASVGVDVKGRGNYSIPRIITLGGDHTTTLAALRETYKHWGAVSVVHFDSHLDTWSPDVIGGSLSEYAGLNHGTFLHVAAEEGLILNSSVHAGLRAPMSGRYRDLEEDAKCGFAVITARDIDRIGVKGVVDRIKRRVKGRVYISVDIDVLDPAFAPGTGTPEVGGWSTRELLAILDGLSDSKKPKLAAGTSRHLSYGEHDALEIIGADVVEVAPAYDNRGETTGLAAAEIAHALMSLMVRTPVAP